MRQRILLPIVLLIGIAIGALAFRESPPLHAPVKPPAPAQPALIQASRATESQKGRLLIVGGGLRDSNTAVYERLVKYAGGAKEARIAVIPTASSSSPPDAIHLTFMLGRLGVQPEHVQLVDLTLANAEKQAVNPQVVAQIESCTGVYFQGGDQSRIMQALVQQGKETPALTAIRGVFRRGGVIAGSSAGAAVQSEWMISVAGLPNDSLDEGLDALDFGVTKNIARRGVLVVPGLGFFQGGIIDQHFSQYRGRLSRLARAAIEQQVDYGFGIDENTALDVAPNGSVEVVGEGLVTIIDARKAECRDGPLGCTINGLRLSGLKEGDRFDPATGKVLADPNKKPIVPGKEGYNGNFLIPDIAGRGAVAYALFMGLGDNTSQTQIGVTLKHHSHSAHGYRFTFRKTPDTKYLEGYINGSFVNSMLDVELDIEPIDGLLQAADRQLPTDLPKQAGDQRQILTTLWRRGILLEDEKHELRPAANVTRAELAGMLAQTIRLEPTRGQAPLLTDVAPDSPWRDSIALVVGKQWMTTDAVGAFRPNDTITRVEAAPVLLALAEHYGDHARTPKTSAAVSELELPDVLPVHRSTALSAIQFGVFNLVDGKFLPDAPLTRLEAAQAVYGQLRFPWSDTAN